MTRTVGAVGPRMPEDEFHNFVYALSQKIVDLESWAAMVNESLNDHADCIDQTKASAHAAFVRVQERTDALRATDARNEADTR